MEDRSPFSNSTEFDIWVGGNCAQGRGCKHDDTWGGSPEAGVWCPLIDLAYEGKWPDEWPVVRGVFVGRCEKYEEVEA